MALTTRGESQKNRAAASICINAIVVVGTVVVLVAVVNPVAVSTNSYSTRTRYCPSYFSSTYNTYCVAYSYSTRGSCSYYGTSYDSYILPFIVRL